MIILEFHIIIRSDKSQTSRSDISFDKELEDSSRTEERQNKLDQKGLNSSPSKNILSKPNIPPPKSPKNMTPKNNNEKNLKNLEKSSERPQKKIFEPVTEPNSEKKNVDNMIPSRNDKKIIKTNNNTIEKDKNNNFNPKLQSNDLKKTASPAKKKIFEPPLKKQEEIPQKSSFKTTTEQIKPNELNPNMKPPEKTKLMNFDDDDDKEAEEEKLPNFGFQGSHSNIREPVESNKFSFAKKAEPIKKIENNDDDEDDDEDDKPIMLQVLK